MACLLQWSLAECWIPEVANGNGDLPGKAFVLPEDGRAACRTGVKVSALPLSAVRVHNWLAFKRMELANLTVVNPHVGVPVAVFRFPPLAGLTWPGI